MKLPRWAWALLVVLLIALAFIGQRLKPPTPAQTIACADPVRGCAFEYRGQTAQLRFSHPPKALQAFTITLQAPGARQVHAELQMQEMDMGANSYLFVPNKPGRFVTHVTLPVCVWGRREWTLNLQIDAQRYTIPFVTL